MINFNDRCNIRPALRSKCMDPLHDNLFRFETALPCTPLIIAFVSHIPLGNNNNQYCFLNDDAKRRKSKARQLSSL